MSTIRCPPSAATVHENKIMRLSDDCLLVLQDCCRGACNALRCAGYPVAASVWGEDSKVCLAAGLTGSLKREIPLFCCSGGKCAGLSAGR